MDEARDKAASATHYTENIFVDGDSHFKAMLADIHLAKESILLETYIFHHDILGKRIAEALVTAARRGVEVRVMVDGAGTQFWGTTLAGLLERAGIRNKVFHPFPWQLWNWSRSVVKIPLLLRWIYFLLKANSRNHRKVCVIDNKIAYIGSFNISKSHLHRNQGGDSWRDTSVRLIGCNLSDLKQAFELAWHHSTMKERLRDAFKHIRDDPPIRLNHTRHRRRILYKHLLRKIQNCKKRIWITNAYFVPDNFLLKRLKEAAGLGIDVRILLPRKSDVMMMPWASSTFYYSLLRSGARIFEYLPSNLHAKSLILDDWMLIGSSNLNHRSLLHDLEADITISTTKAKNSLVNKFLEDLKHSSELSLDSWESQRPRRQRFLGKIVLYIKYWI